MENNESLFGHVVEKYYSAIDSGDFKMVFSLFSENVVYKRCEKEIKGIEELKIFYEQERALKGRHILKIIIVEDNNVAVKGIFEGKNGKNEDIKLEFADFFVFNDNGKISERYTYLARGYESTK